MRSKQRFVAEAVDHRGLNRRQTLLGLLGAGAAVACGCCGALAQTAGDQRPYRIDTHQHILPPKWLAEERDRVLYASQGAPASLIDDWTPEKSVDDMDKGGVKTSVISISTPGVFMGDVVQGRRLARACNEYGAGMIQKYPGRFGMFAAIPLPDVEGSLKEIEYALDVLKLNGVGLMTSYGDKWPGDPAFYPVFEELNRRKATVYFHPTTANCCGDTVPGVPRAIIEFPTDTTRCAASLYVNGVLSRCHDITFILSHGGGSLPMFAGRIDDIISGRTKPVWPTRALEEFKRLNYDTAAILSAPAFAALLKLVPTSQILMGSDFPYRSTVRVTREIRALGIFSDAELMAIERDNALRLVPGLKA
jgi:predicted TIM-barrel fold metal-dependent hydrolase